MLIRRKIELRLIIIIRKTRRKELLLYEKNFNSYLIIFNITTK